MGGIDGNDFRSTKQPGVPDHQLVEQTESYNHDKIAHDMLGNTDANLHNLPETHPDGFVV